MEAERRQTTPGVTLAAAFTVASLAQILRIPRLFPAAAFLLSLSAVLLLRGLFGRTPEPPEEPLAVPQAPTPERRRLGHMLAALGGAGSIACSLLLSFDFRAHLMQVLIAGPLSLLLLAAGADLLYGRSTRDPHRLREKLWPLLLLLAVGAVFRFASFGWFPPADGFSSIEEMQRASGGSSILGGARPWEFPLAQYLNAASFALFGKSMAAVRLPATFLAWLTLPVFYFLARELVSRPAALFATALLAVSRWHCQVGWYNEDVYVPLLPFTLLLYLLLRSRRDPRPSLYILAGALCGYMLYDYAAYRSAPLVTAAFFAAEALRRRRWPEDGRRIALLFAIVLLFALPLMNVLGRGRGGAGFYFESLERSFDDKSYYTWEMDRFVGRRLSRVDKAAGVFATSDSYEFFTSLNIPWEPLLDPVTSVFFVVGFGTTLLLWRRRQRAFVGFGFLVLATGAMIVTWNLDFRRLAILIPFVFAFVAFLAQEVEMQARRGGWLRRWHRLLLLAAISAGAANAYFLFLRLAPDHSVRAAHRTPYTVVLTYLRQHWKGEYVTILSHAMDNFFESNDYDWMKPQLLFGRVAEDVDDLLGPLPPPAQRRPLLFLVARPHDIHTVLFQIEDAYPGARCEFRADADDTRHDLGVCRVERF